jgi:hypothetical protein
MESKIIVSRSVVIDPFFKKNMVQNYEKHKLKLEEIKTRKTSLNLNEPENLKNRKLSVAKVQD